MPMCDLIEYSDNYSKTSRILWQYCRDVPAVDANGACGSFTKNKERIQKFIETGDSRYIYQNELVKACF